MFLLVVERRFNFGDSKFKVTEYETYDEVILEYNKILEQKITDDGIVANVCKVIKEIEGTAIGGWNEETFVEDSD